MSTVVTSVKYDICSEGCRLKKVDVYQGGSTPPPSFQSSLVPPRAPMCRRLDGAREGVKEKHVASSLFALMEDKHQVKMKVGCVCVCV